MEYTPHPCILRAITAVPANGDEVPDPTRATKSLEGDLRSPSWMVVRNGKLDGAMLSGHSRLGAFLSPDDFRKWLKNTRRKYLVPTSFEIFYLDDSVDREVVAELLGDLTAAEIDRDMARASKK